MARNSVLVFLYKKEVLASIYIISLKFALQPKFKGVSFLTDASKKNILFERVAPLKTQH